jgi:hypothetical protein
MENGILLDLEPPSAALEEAVTEEALPLLGWPGYRIPFPGS